MGAMGQHEGRPGDASLRGLAAPGPSKVGTDAAMRARDVSRADVAPRGAGRATDGARSGGRGQRVGSDGSSGSSPVDS
jgi:hypothetical protein